MMQPELVVRLVGLVQKTGERLVLADPTTGKAVVVMDLEQYERLCAVAPDQAAVQISDPNPFQAPKIEVEIPQKIAKQSDNPFKKRGRQLGVEIPLESERPRDLTQEELLDKINRDIGDWKTAQERRRTDELKSVAHGIADRSAVVSALEDEERFYLEPIE